MICPACGKDVRHAVSFLGTTKDELARHKAPDPYTHEQVECPGSGTSVEDAAAETGEDPGACSVLVAALAVLGAGQWPHT